MERVTKVTAGFKWLIIGSVKVHLDAIKHMRFEKAAGNLSSSYVVGLVHGLFNVILLTVPINFQQVKAMSSATNAVVCKPLHSSRALNMSVFHVLRY
jgi:hypothetical protein